MQVDCEWLQLCEGKELCEECTQSRAERDERLAEFEVAERVKREAEAQLDIFGGEE